MTSDTSHAIEIRWYVDQLHAALGAALGSGVMFLLSAWFAQRLAPDSTVASREFLFMCAGLGMAAVLAVMGFRRSTRASWQAGLVFGLVCVFMVARSGFAVDDPTAASLSILIPLTFCQVKGRGVYRAVVMTVTVLAVGLGAIAIGASSETSAVSGLVIGAGAGVWMWWRSRTLARSTLVRSADALAAVGVVGGAALYVAAMWWPVPPAVATRLPSFLIDRRNLWQDVLPVVSDYWFTGSGLGATPMVLSTYVWQLHVPYHPHAHHLFLQVAVQQGLPGLIGLIGMFVAAAWTIAVVLRSPNADIRRCAAASGTALAVLAISGLWESDFIGTALMPVLFLPFGCALGLGRAVLDATAGHEARRRGWFATMMGGAAPFVVLVLLAAWPGARARWHANRGATLQTQAELRVYHWPEWSIQDRLRREHIVDLEPALVEFQRALALDPTNATAHRRLGQVALSEGRADDALRHLLAAHATAPWDRATDRLLAEVYATTGDGAAAAALWKTTGTTRQDLEPRLWWYRYVGADVEATRLSEAAETLPAAGTLTVR